jgi:hypothetical protein
MDVNGDRLVRLLPRRLSLLLGAVGLALSILAASASAAAADRPSSCSGSLESPGVLAGTYSSNVTVEGACVVKGQSAVIDGNLTVSPGAVLAAAFANSNLTVQGNLKVQRGAVLILGCGTSPDFPCLDNEQGSSQGSVSGNLSEQKPLGVVVHATTIGGSVQDSGGGGGFTCSNKGPTVDGFYVFGGAAFGGFPVYSDYSGGSTVHGNLSVVGLNSCYLGVAGMDVGGNVNLINNQLADPDGAEIIGNQISGNLVCQDNSQVWDSFEAVPAGPLFPRVPDPNTVSGDRVGQCVLASPETEGGPSGPGPF